MIIFFHFLADKPDEGMTEYPDNGKESETEPQIQMEACLFRKKIRTDVYRTGLRLPHIGFVIQ